MRRFKIGQRVEVRAAHAPLRGTIVEIREHWASIGVLLDAIGHCRFYRPRYVTVLGVVDLLAELTNG